MFETLVEKALPCLLHSAAHIDGAAGSVLYRFDPETRDLSVMAHEGVSPKIIAFAASRTADDGSATGSAIVERRRVVIRDVLSGYRGELRAAMVEAGIRAVISYPLIDSQRQLEGALTLYYPEPHHPTFEATTRIGARAEVAGQILEVSSLKNELDRVDAAAGICGRTLAPAVRNGLSDVCRAITHCRSTADYNHAIPGAARNLNAVISELRAVLDGTGSASYGALPRRSTHTSPRLH